MSRNRRELGFFGEDMAAEYVSDAGLHVLERNWRNGRLGELDLIAADPLNDCYVVIEVRTRTSQRCGSAHASVDWKKYQRLRRLAAAWLSRQRIKRHIRIDVVAVELLPQAASYVKMGGSLSDLGRDACDITWVKAVAA